METISVIVWCIAITRWNTNLLIWFISVFHVGEIRDLWAKIYIFFDTIPAACRNWLKVGFRKVRRAPVFSTKKEPKYIITSERLHFKNCRKSGPKVPTLKDQWPMAKGPLDHVVLSGNFITIFTEYNQILVIYNEKWNFCLYTIKKKNDSLHFCNKNTKCSGNARFLHNIYFT